MLSNTQKLEIMKNAITRYTHAMQWITPENVAERAYFYGRILRKQKLADELQTMIENERRDAQITADMEAITVYNARYDNDLFANVQLAVARAFDVSIKVVRDQPDSDAFQTVTLVLDSAEFYCGVQSRAYAPAELLKIMVARPDMSPAVSKFLARFLFPSNR